MLSWGFRVIGSLIIFCGGVLAANYFNGKASRILAEAESCAKLVRYVREQVDSYAMPLPEILVRISTEEVFESILHKEDEDSVKIFKELAENIKITDFEVRKSIIKFLKDFGRASREEEIKECDDCFRCISARRNILAENLPKQKKINTVLCIAASLALIILML